MPDTSTKPYRVVGVGAVYRRPSVDIDENGEERTVLVTELGLRGQTIDLIPFEAKRLGDLGAVKPVDAERSYDEMDDVELEKLTTERLIDVRGSGADGAIRREDRINALNVYDRGAVSGLVGVGTAPGGVAITQTGTGEGVMIDEATGLPREGTEASSPAAGAPDAESADVDEIAAYIENEKPNADETVALAKDDPELASKVLEAENVATGGDPRKGVEDRLGRLAES